MNVKVNDAEVLVRYQAGETGPAIAKSLNVRPDTIYESLDRSKCPRRKQVGPQHVHWRGGVSEKHNQLRFDPAYKDWKMKVIQRDGFTCQLCCRHGGPLHVHHIIKKADAPELIFTVSNGITLCGECHNHLITGKEKRFARLLAAAVKMGRPICTKVYQIIYQGHFDVPPQKCACGCGKWTRIFYGKPNKFIRGHQGIGRKKSEELRQRMSDQQRFKDELIAKAQAMYDSDKSTIEVAAALNVSQGWVKKVCKTRSQSKAQQLRFERDGPPVREPKVLPMENIIAKYRSGIGVLELADEHKVSHMTLRKRLKAAGEYKPNPTGVTLAHLPNR